MSLKCVQKFECANLTGTNCTTESKLNDTFSYLMKPCSNTTQDCKWGSADPVNNTNVVCSDSPVLPTPLYPGEACTTDSKCFGGVCTNGTCPGSAANANCTAHSECVVGLSCFVNVTANISTCRKQAIEGGDCYDDNDCINTSGCNTDNKCKAYFSANFTTPVKFLPGELSFCASGEATEAGVCVNKKNNGADPFECNDANTCSYTNTADNTTITDPKACACSKGSSFKSFCALGNGQQEYVDYVTALKAYLQKTVDKNCHTVERLNCGLLNKAEANAFSTLSSKRIYAQTRHILRDAPDCAIKIMYPSLVIPGPPPSNTTTCPKVKCDKLASGTCAAFAYDTATNKGNFIGQSCDDTKRCDVTIDIFKSNSTENKTCVAKPTDAIKNRYPGEKCDTKNTCIDPQTCTSGACTGKAAADNCAASLECKVGLYCKLANTTNTTNGTNATGACTAQVAAGGVCTDDYQCPNSQGCMAGKCTDYFSQALGANIGNTSSQPANLCKSQAFTIVNNTYTCYGVSYSGMSPNKDGMVTCDINTPLSCAYKDNIGNDIKENCQCSYDKNGTSYCRKAYNETDPNWIKLATSSKDRTTSTKCHTNNRFGCYDVKDSFKADNFNAQIATVKAANFFYADECIKKLFNSGEFIKISFAILAVLVINLI
jgi:hypothetical protein